MDNMDNSEDITCDLSERTGKNLFEINWDNITNTIGNIEITEQERRILKWLSENDPDTVNAICSVMDKIKKPKTGRKLKVDKNKIRNYKNKGYTQEWIANKLKVSVSTIRRYWK